MLQSTFRISTLSRSVRGGIVLASVIATSASPVHAQWWKNLVQPNAQTPYGQNPYAQPQYGQNYDQRGSYDLGPASNSLKSIERNADQLLKTIQMKAAYAPQANFAPLLVSLNALKDTARQARRYCDSNDLSNLNSRLSQLQVVAGNAVNIAHSDPAIADGYTVAQLQTIQASVQQATMYVANAPLMVPGGNPNPYNPYGPYNPPYNPYNPYERSGYYPPPVYNSGIIQASSSGRGQFTMMGQNLLSIKNATLSCADPVSRRATFTMSQGNATINLLGTLVSQTPNSVTLSITSSDRGNANGTITGVLSGNGSLSSANGNGTLNGQPFIVSFRGN